ncbi:MAG: glycosyltransferase, partial [Pseudomonadota bacterium]
MIKETSVNDKTFQGEIFHDYFAISGGGEKLVTMLARDLNWHISGGFISPEYQQLNSELLTILHSLKAFAGFKPLQMLSLIQKWKNCQSKLTGNKVYSGVYAPLSAVNHPNCFNILYCHTPPRFVYDKKDYYLSSLPKWQAIIFAQLIRYFQQQYEPSLLHMDQIIVNSRHVQQRFKHYLKMDSEVVYPPCDTKQFSFISQGDYYLSTARLDGLKRVEVIVQAFIKMPDKKLIVCSGGPELAKLQKLAENSTNITFTNWISQAELVDLVANCIATIYIPWDEDFGISPIESMAAGKPVIGVNEGGLKETIVDQQTGYLLDAEKSSLLKQLITIVQNLTAEHALSLRENCEKQAELFSESQFLDNMRAYFK